LNAAGTAAFLGLGASILVSMVTIYLLSKAPSGMSRNLAAALMMIILSSSALMLAALLTDPSGFSKVAELVSELLLYWSAAVGFHMNVSFSEWKGRVSGLKGALPVYLPMLALSAVVSWGAAEFPAAVIAATSRANPIPSFGILDTLFLGTGAVYVLGSMTVLAWMLKKGAGPIQTELRAILGILLLQIVVGLLLMLEFPNVPGATVFLMVGVLLGLVLSDAARKGSLLIVPQKENPVLDEPLRLLRPGATYIFLREKQQARELFVLYLKSGRPGLWITRRPPREARELYGLDKTPFIWLTSSIVPGENCLDPGEFGPLSTAISSFTREAKDYLILIEGVEYIVTKTGFPTVLKLVQYLNDRVMSTGGMLLLGMNPQAFNDSELALLKSEAAGVFEDEDIKTPFRGRAEGPRRKGAAQDGTSAAEP
jgi:hypothetical protein